MLVVNSNVARYLGLIYVAALHLCKFGCLCLSVSIGGMEGNERKCLQFLTIFHIHIEIIEKRKKIAPSRQNFIYFTNIFVFIIDIENHKLNKSRNLKPVL